MVFSNFKKMSKWGVAASVAVALLGAGSAAYAGFAVGNIGSAKGLKATPSTDVFGNSLDNLILGQLSTEDLDSAGIDYSACGSSPLPAYVLDYLETILSQDAEDTSEWQSDIDAISNCDFDAAVWQVGEANDNNSAATVVTASVLDEIVGEDGYVNAMLAANSSTDISDVQALFPSALASVTASSVKIMIAETVVGFASQAEANAYNSNSDKANYTVTTFNACYVSTNSDTGGANSCSVAYSTWNSLSTIETALNDNTTITAASLDDILTADNSSSSSNLDYTNNSMHLDYMTSCIDDLSDRSIANMAACATASTAKASAAKYGLANFKSSYTLDNSTLSDAGLSDNNSNILGSTATNSCFDTTCASVLSTFLQSDNNTLTSSSSSSAILTALNGAFDDYYTTKAEAVTPVTNSNAPTGGSCATVTKPAPGLCSHQPSTHIYCTVHTSNFSINDPTYTQVSYDGSTSAISGTVYKNYTLKYRSRRSNTVLRTETRKFKITVSSSDQANSWQTVTRHMCSGSPGYATNLKSCCENEHNGTVATENQLKVWSGNSNWTWYLGLGDDQWAVSEDNYFRNQRKSYSGSCTGSSVVEQKVRNINGGLYYRFCKRNSSSTWASGARVRCNKPICN